MIKVGIVGVSGYSGVTALEILLNHSQVRVHYVSANNTKGPVADIWPHLAARTSLICDKYNPDSAIQDCEIAFLAVPHTVAMDIAPRLLKDGKKVIDLSADYRFRDAKLFEQWYTTSHKDVKNLKHAVYGLPEIYREKIKKATLIANPGCYPTAAILALAPLATAALDNIHSIIIDAKSGVTGAGRKVSLGFIFSEVNENFKAYRVLKHQHTPEITYYLSQLTDERLPITFVPHLLPVNRGILETIYIEAKTHWVLNDLEKIYKKFYKTEPFIRILPLGTQPELKNVQHTNFCDLGLAVSEDKKMLVITAAIDNLMKGASGQAVQNMNLMCGFRETEGLL